MQNNNNKFICYFLTIEMNNLRAISNWVFQLAFCFIWKELKLYFLIPKDISAFYPSVLK